MGRGKPSVAIVRVSNIDEVLDHRLGEAYRFTSIVIVWSSFANIRMHNFHFEGEYVVILAVLTLVVVIVSISWLNFI